LGAEVSVDIPALPQSPFTGKVVAIVPQGDVRARTFPVKIAIQNQTTESGPLIKPGMYARVELPVGSMKQAVLVPKDAVVLDQRSPLVYVVEGASVVGEQGTVSPVPVTLGRSHGALIDIGDSLKPGQIVVVEGNERLRPGATISISRLTESPAGP
jgi:RND family efflux transporter MFP subunit